MQAFHPLDLPLLDSEIGGDGNPCSADPQNYRRPDQVPQFPLSPAAANCTVRRAMQWCYSQPKWFSGKAVSCTVRFPVMPGKIYTVNAPFVLQTAVGSKYPVKIILDGSGNTILQTAAVGSKTQVFSTHINNAPRARSMGRHFRVLIKEEEEKEEEIGQGRNLAVQQYDNQMNAPVKKGQMNSLVVANCTLTGFGDSLRDGGTISVSHLQSFGLVDVTIQNSYGRYGGAVSATNVAFVFIVRSKILNNRASSGGGLSILNATAAYITGSTLQGNKADVIGGAMVLDTVGSFSMDASAVLFNSAASFGGGVSLNNLALRTRVLNCTFSNNRATYGSALAMGSVVNATIVNNTMARNMATYGGGVYWLFKTMRQPLGLAANNTFYDNFAPYGPNYATDSVKLVANPTSLMIVDYVNRERITATSVIKDFYDQTLNDNSSLGSVFVDPNVPKNCGFNNYLAGVSGNVNAIAVRGIASFKYKSSCIPGGDFHLTYLMVASVIPETFPVYDEAVLLSPRTKQLTAEADIFFRTCLVGEKYDFFTVAKDSCSACVKSFSIEDNSDLHVVSCRPCPPDTMGCTSKYVYLYPGTWRWNEGSTTILACPYPRGCIGLNYTGIASCDTGYSGVMCGICNWGYFPSSDGVSCAICTGQSLITPPLVILLLVLVFGVLLPGYLRLRKFAKNRRITIFDAAMLLVLGKPEDEDARETAADRREKATRRSWISRYKIFSATYQVVVSSPGTFQVRMGPFFTNFVSSMKVVNFDFVSYVPVQCFTEFDYIGSMQTTSLSPFIVVAVVMTIGLFNIFVTYSGESDRMRRRVKLTALYKRYFSMCIVIMSTVLVSVTLKLFNIFNCFDVDPLREAGDGKDHRFLRVDVAIDCNSKVYNDGVSFAVLFILVYPFGVPMTFFYLMWISKPEITARGLRARQMAIADELAQDVTMPKAQRIVQNRKLQVLRDRFARMHKSGGGIVDSLTFLYEVYHPEFWFWEIIEIMYKITSTCIIALIEPGTPMQVTFAVILASMYIKAYSSFQPFVQPFDNTVAELGQYQIFFTFFCIMIMMQSSLGDPGAVPEMYTALDIFLVAVNFTVIGTLVGVTMFEWGTKKGEADEDEDENGPRVVAAKEGLEEEKSASAGLDIRNILEALRRHPNVLIRLGERLQTAMPEGSRRPGMTLHESDLNTLRLLMTSRASRRNAVSMNRIDWIAGMKKKHPRRGAVIVPAQALADLNKFLQAQSSSEEGSSLSSLGSDDDGVSDGTSASREEAEERRGVASLTRASVTLKAIGINLQDPFGRADDDVTTVSQMTERSSIHSYLSASSDRRGDSRSDDERRMDKLSPWPHRTQPGSDSGSESNTDSGLVRSTIDISPKVKGRGADGFIYDPSLNLEGSDISDMSDPGDCGQGGEYDFLAAEGQAPLLAPAPELDAYTDDAARHGLRAAQARLEEPFAEYADPSTYPQQQPDDVSLTSDQEDDVLQASYVDTADAALRAAAKVKALRAEDEDEHDDDDDNESNGAFELDLRRFVFQQEDADAMVHMDYRPGTVDLEHDDESESDDANANGSFASGPSHEDTPNNRQGPAANFNFGEYRGPAEEDYDSFDSDSTEPTSRRES